MEAGAEAVDIARGLGDDEVLAAALHGAHTSLLNVSHLGERLAVSEEVIAVSRRQGDRESTLRGLQSRSSTWCRPRGSRRRGRASWS
jgi:hypothetical protein